MIGGLTILGVFHTAIALVAVVCGFIALARDKEISPHNRLGQAYLLLTLVTALTAFGIFQHGGFGPPHVVAVLTLVALAVGIVAARSHVFGRASRYVQTISYSATVLFHMIPAITETSTRLPPGAPLVPSQDAPVLLIANLALLILFLAGATLQVQWLRRSLRAMTAGPTVGPPVSVTSAHR
jgi:uncharacterized membrane protein